MRIDMPTCQYGEDHCRKRFDGNCFLNPNLLDERCPIRRTINDVLEIIDEFEKKPVRCKDSVYIINNDELWNAIKLHLTTEIMKLRGDKE